MFCREIVTDLHREWSEQSGRPKPFFVHPGTKEAGDAFFSEEWPEIGAVADPDALLYRDFDLRPAPKSTLFAPKTYVNAARALFRGQLPRKPVGDPRQMPGYFVIEDGAMRWAYRPSNPGDHDGLWKAWKANDWA